MTEIIAGLVLAVVAALVGYFKGRGGERKKAERAYQQTREKIDNAGNDVDGASPDELNRRLWESVKR
jgi:hypothetical protein